MRSALHQVQSTSARSTQVTQTSWELLPPHFEWCNPMTFSWSRTFDLGKLRVEQKSKGLVFGEAFGIGDKRQEILCGFHLRYVQLTCDFSIYSTWQNASKVSEKWSGGWRSKLMLKRRRCHLLLTEKKSQMKQFSTLLYDISTE